MPKPEQSWRHSPVDPRLCGKRLVVRYAGGEVYRGEVFNGKRQGEGSLWTPVGSLGRLRLVYRGSWASDVPEGVGEALDAEGIRYEGEWSNGLRDGSGVCVIPETSVYVGSWKKGWQHGPGREVYADGSTFEGTFLQGLKHGRGVYRSKGTGRRLSALYRGGVAVVGAWAAEAGTAPLPAPGLAAPEAVLEQAELELA